MNKFLSTEDFQQVLQTLTAMLSHRSLGKNSGRFIYTTPLSWVEGDVLGRTAVNVFAQVDWTAGQWMRIGDYEVRRLDGDAEIRLTVDDTWDFTTHENDPWYTSLFDEIVPGAVADLYSLILTGDLGSAFPLWGRIYVDKDIYAFQFRRVE